MDLNRLDVFARVCEARSFSAAATRLGVPRSTVSRAMAALEAEVGEQLLERTTRAMTITEEGKLLLARVAPSLLDLRAALEEIEPRHLEPTGTVRVTTTTEAGLSVIAEAAVRFTARYPRANVEIELTAKTVDLARDGFDFALRATMTKLADSSLIARRVGAITFQLFAAPSYLARRGAPQAPGSIGEHPWVGVRLSSLPRVDEVLARRGLPTQSRVICNDMFFVREVLRRGGGIGALPSFLADEDLRVGSLLRVLPKFTVARVSLHLVHIARKKLPLRVAAFRDILLDLLRERPFAP